LEQHSFGYWLRRKRKALDLTREGLADRVGCSVSTIRKLEAEERHPSALIAGRLADIFHIPAEERGTFLQFARGHWESAPGLRNNEASWHAPTLHPLSNLPATSTSIIGRDKEIETVHGYLSNPAIRLVTLIGPPGIGKTRLGIQSANESLTEFSDGVVFVALALLDHPSLIPSAILQALGYVERQDLPADKHLIEDIGAKQILLVLDNCEHLIEDVAPLASGLLSACSRLKILATSREALRIPGEWLYSVPGLDGPEDYSNIDIKSLSKCPALVLFAERARAARSDFALNAENIQAVASICSQLDGLPLAIELIAARIRFMSPQTLLERLNDKFILSADGMRGVPRRQKSLNNVIGWSYDLLSSEEQKLFAFLSVFSGGFALEAAETIFSQAVMKKSVSDHITSLVDKSILQQIVDESDRSRFTMLVTIQRFALDRLRSAELEIEARQAHLDYFIELAERGDKEIRGPSAIEWIGQIEREHNNLRAALEWSVSHQDAESALRLLCALGWFWQLAGHFSEARDWLNRIRKLSGVNSHPAIYARLLNHIGRISWTQDRMEEARSLLEESQIICRQLGDGGEPILAEASNWFGLLVLSREQDTEKARSLVQQGLELYQKWGIQQGVALSLFNLGIVEIQSNHDELACSLLEKSLLLSYQSGDLIFVARISRFLGNLLLRQGKYKKARLYFEEHLRIDTELKFWDGIGHAYGELGNLFRYQGDYGQAEEFYKKSLEVHEQHGLEPDVQYFHCLVLTALHLNDYPLASQRIVKCYDMARKLEEKTSAYGLFIGQAAVAAGLHQYKPAARLSGMAQAILQTTSFRYEPIDHAEFDRHIQIARDHLGDARFDVLASEGRAMALDRAIEYALGVSTIS
jgi:predicted ATPase/transcriptional regulator with XRE-family HTH domain